MYNFQAKRATFTFFAQICSNTDFGVETGVSRTPCVQILRQSGQLCIASLHWMEVDRAG